MPNPAPCCKLALAEATEHWPDRDKSSDGIMGDSHHQQHHSDHNLGNAFDLTNDPAHSVTCQTLSRQAINDPRVTYVIWNREIYNRARAAEGWRAYHGENPHDHHMHVSIKPGSRDDLSPWPWAIPGSKATPDSHGASHHGSGHASSSAHQGAAGTLGGFEGEPLTEGKSGAQVLAFQQRLKQRGWSLSPDGVFGPKTREIVVQFQRNHNLVPDGIVGPKTWAAMAAATTPGSSAPANTHATSAYAGNATHSANHHHSRPANVVSFIDLALPSAKRVRGTYGVPVSFMIAQGGLESGWGQRVVHNAYFGIKGKSESGGTSNFGTTEYVNGKKVHTNANFRAYRNFEEAADDYGKFLTTNSRYRPAFSYKDDPLRFADAIARAGYATDPNYAHSIKTIINSYSLTEYDK